jgi:excisionase family DNA binding protein
VAISVDTPETDQRDRRNTVVGAADSREFNTDDVYITTGEAARILRVSPKTVARWAKEGKLPHLVTLGGHRRFPAAAIEDLARRLRVVT